MPMCIPLFSTTGVMRRMPSPYYMLVLLVVFWNHRLPCTESFSASSPSPSPSPFSPWAPSTWILTLDFGREKGTSMPESYGASGSRIVTPITVEITSDAAAIDKNDSSLSSFVGPGASTISPKSVGSYITMQGEQPLELFPGGWTLEFPPGKQGLASTLRFWMTLQNSIVRNDVQLSAGERLYFTSNAWREEEYEVGLQRMKPIQARAKEAQRILDDQLSHETGDRRLDGNDALETIQAYGDMAQLVLDRDTKRQEYNDALEKYPPVSEELPEGPWPGAEEWLTLSNSKNLIWVARSKRLSVLGDEYHIAGTWTAAPVLSEDQYEIVYEDDNEDARL